MKLVRLSGLLIVASLVFQSCHSPETRAINDDSTTVDSGQTAGDSTGMTTQGMDSTADEQKTSSNITNEAQVDSDEGEFMKTAAVGGMMEVELGKIAQRSANPKVKAFAAQMVADHGKANAELKALAEEKEIVLPTAYPADQQAHVDMMKKMTGKEFDQHYMDMMVTDHDKTVTLFQRGSNSQTKAVSDFAKKTLPVIIAHGKKAKAIQAELR